MAMSIQLIFFSTFGDEPFGNGDKLETIIVHVCHKLIFTLIVI